MINKQGAAQRKSVLFINADREYREGKNQNKLRPEDIEKISNVYRNQIEAPKYSRRVPLSELAAEDYNLNIRRYVDNAPAPEPQDVKAHLNGGIPRPEKEALKQLKADAKTGKRSRQGATLFDSADDDVLVMGPAERVARHDKLVKELKDLKSDSKAMEKRTQELVDAARLTIKPAQAEQLILARWERTLYGTIDGYLKQYRQSFVAAIENLHGKYSVTLKSLLTERDAENQVLNQFLMELGYE